MHEIQFRKLPQRGLGRSWGSLQRSPRPPGWLIKGGLLLREGGEGKQGEGEDRKVRGSDCPLFSEILNTPLCNSMQQLFILAIKWSSQ